MSGNRLLGAYLSCALIAPGFVAAQGPAPSAAWFARSPQLKTDVRPDPGGGFTLEVPRDWKAMPAGHDTVFTIGQKKAEATISVEVTPLRIPQRQEDVDTGYLEYRREEALALYPRAASVVSGIVEQAGLRVVALQFATPGLTGSDLVRTYVFLDGDKLYRLVCRAPAALFARHESVCAHVAGTFRPKGATAAPPATGW